MISDIALHRLAQHYQGRHVDGIIVLVFIGRAWLFVSLFLGGVIVIEMAGGAKMEMRRLLLPFGVAESAAASQGGTHSLKENHRHQKIASRSLDHGTCSHKIQ